MFSIVEPINVILLNFVLSLLTVVVSAHVYQYMPYKSLLDQIGSLIVTRQTAHFTSTLYLGTVTVGNNRMCLIPNVLSEIRYVVTAIKSMERY